VLPTTIESLEIIKEKIERLMLVRKTSIADRQANVINFTKNMCLFQLVKKEFARIALHDLENDILDVKCNLTRNQVRIQVIQSIQWNLDNSTRTMDITRVRVVPNIPD
jgi:hypothetical protein